MLLWMKPGDSDYRGTLPSLSRSCEGLEKDERNSAPAHESRNRPAKSLPRRKVPYSSGLVAVLRIVQVE